MHAMILAAGRGERMRPLTDHTPKPLLQVAGKPLIEYRIENLAKAGITEIVINVSWLKEQIMAVIGDGSRWGVNIRYSIEPEALETAGGIVQALPLLGEQPFLVVNADIWADYPFATLIQRGLSGNYLAHLVMTENPPQHKQGDFYLLPNGQLCHNDSTEGRKLTFAGISIFSPVFFQQATVGKQPLLPLLVKAMEKRLVSGEYFAGPWEDVGNVERLVRLNSSSRRAQ